MGRGRARRRVVRPDRRRAPFAGRPAGVGAGGAPHPRRHEPDLSSQGVPVRRGRACRRRDGLVPPRPPHVSSADSRSSRVGADRAGLRALRVRRRVSHRRPQPSRRVAGDAPSRVPPRGLGDRRLLRPGGGGLPSHPGPPAGPLAPAGGSADRARARRPARAGRPPKDHGRGDRGLDHRHSPASRLDASARLSRRPQPPLRVRHARRHGGPLPSRGLLSPRRLWDPGPSAGPRDRSGWRLDADWPASHGHPSPSPVHRGVDPQRRRAGLGAPGGEHHRRQRDRPALGFVVWDVRRRRRAAVDPGARRALSRVSRRCASGRAHRRQPLVGPPEPGRRRALVALGSPPPRSS